MNLERWTANTVPRRIGSGRRRGDGDLEYLVRIEANSFIQGSTDPNRDEGNITGAFFGTGHKAMGATLERDDLAAGFGRGETRVT